MKNSPKERWALAAAFAALAAVFCMAVATLPATAEGEKAPPQYEPAHEDRR